jgi:urocanate hydratase
MSLVALHNGGGVGVGKAVNGGFGLVLDGSRRVDEIIQDALPWDVMVGVARRAWSRNPHSMETGAAYNRDQRETAHITLPFIPEEKLVQTALQEARSRNRIR